MKIYAPNIKADGIGGGWTFLRNFKKGMNMVHFVDKWEDCDIFFITGITIVDKNEVIEAKKAGKKIVFRVDNIPRKSRNRRNTPHERMKEIADLSDVVIYQSEWAKKYCYPITGNGAVILNGVDTSIFKKTKESDSDRENNYLFVYHGKNEMKQFWLAHYYFQMIFRDNPQAKFLFIYDFKRELPEMQEANFDFWNGENYEYLPKIDNPEDMASLMRECKYLIYPSISDASPNTVLEARACGMEILYPAPNNLAGTQELIELDDITMERMCEEYYGIFKLLTSDF